MLAFTREELIVQALEKIFGRTVKANISNGEVISWNEPSEVQPSRSQLDIEVQRIIDDIPNVMLRRERDSRLMECDWRVSPDYPHVDQPAWIEYRQKLRDLPQNIESGIFPKPTLSEQGQLLFNSWPAPPS
jgi:hypothetical protein